MANFQTFYGKTLGANVVYINSAGKFATIDGSETFTLVDQNVVTVDGPTIAEPAAGQKTFSRVNCGTAAGAATSWAQATTATAAATPGTGPLSTG